METEGRGGRGMTGGRLEHNIGGWEGDRVSATAHVGNK